MGYILVMTPEVRAWLHDLPHGDRDRPGLHGPRAALPRIRCYKAVIHARPLSTRMVWLPQPRAGT